MSPSTTGVGPDESSETSGNHSLPRRKTRDGRRARGRLSVGLSQGPFLAAPAVRTAWLKQGDRVGRGTAVLTSVDATVDGFRRFPPRGPPTGDELSPDVARRRSFPRDVSGCTGTFTPQVQVELEPWRNDTLGLVPHRGDTRR